MGWVNGRERVSLANDLSAQYEPADIVVGANNTIDTVHCFQTRVSLSKELTINTSGIIVLVNGHALHLVALKRQPKGETGFAKSWNESMLYAMK
jgi:hypothetical protein